MNQEPTSDSSSNNNAAATTTTVKAGATINPYTRPRKDAAVVATTTKLISTTSKANATAAPNDVASQEAATSSKHLPIKSPPQATTGATNAAAFSIKKGDVKVLGTKKNQEKMAAKSLRAKLKRDIAIAKAKMAQAMAKPKDVNMTATGAVTATAISEPRAMTKAPPNVPRPIATRMPVVATEGLLSTESPTLSKPAAIASHLVAVPAMVETAKEQVALKDYAPVAASAISTTEIMPTNNTSPASHETTTAAASPLPPPTACNHDQHIGSHNADMEAVRRLQQTLQNYQSIYTPPTMRTPFPFMGGQHQHPFYTYPPTRPTFPPNQFYYGHRDMTPYQVPNPLDHHHHNIATETSSAYSDMPPSGTPSPWIHHQSLYQHQQQPSPPMFHDPYPRPPPQLLHSWQQQMHPSMSSPWNGPSIHHDMPRVFPQESLPAPVPDSYVSHPSLNSVVTSSPWNDMSVPPTPPSPPNQPSLITLTNESTTALTTSPIELTERKSIECTGSPLEVPCSTVSTDAPPHPKAEGSTVTPSPTMVKKEMHCDEQSSELTDSWKESTVKSPKAVPTTATTDDDASASCGENGHASETERTLDMMQSNVKVQVSPAITEDIEAPMELKTDATGGKTDEGAPNSAPMIVDCNIADCRREEMNQQIENGKAEEAPVPPQVDEETPAPPMQQPLNCAGSSLPAIAIVQGPTTPLFPHQSTVTSNIQPPSNFLIQNGFVPACLPFNPMTSMHHFGTAGPGLVGVQGGSWVNPFCQLPSYSLAVQPSVQQLSALPPNWPIGISSSGTEAIGKGINPNSESSFVENAANHFIDNSKMALLVGATSLAHSSCATKEKFCILSAKPLDAPSPYVFTHHVVSHAMIVTKPGIDGSFGIVVKSVESSVLVDQPGDEISPSKDAQGSSNATSKTDATVSDVTSIVGEETAVVTTKRRRPRKRVYFVVMQVMSLSTQYELFPIEEDKRLREGDVVLSIQDKSVCGLPFAEAVKLFRCNYFDQGTNGTLQCRLTVARPTDPIVVGNAVKVPKEPIAKPVPLHGPFTTREKEAVAKAYMMAYTHQSRRLGSTVSPDLFDQCLIECSSGSSYRDGKALSIALHKYLIPDLMDRVKGKAEEYWQQSSHGQATDLARGRARALPRPLKGCRCGASDHEFVNDPKCMLYSNLRALSGREEISTKPQRRIRSSLQTKALSNIGVAYKNRLECQLEEKANLEEEARFVALMEDIQVRQLRQAIFAPSRAVMIISAIVSLGKGSASKDIKARDCHVDDDDEDSDEDEDIPLAALGRRAQDTHTSYSLKNETAGKRTLDEKERSPEKRQKTCSVDQPIKNEGGVQTSALDDHVKGQIVAPIGQDATAKFVVISYESLARIARHISFTWGHCFQEPSDGENAWRWAVYNDGRANGHTVAKNPRKPGSFPFENIRFVLDDEIVASLAQLDRVAAEESKPDNLVSLSKGISSTSTNSKNVEKQIDASVLLSIFVGPSHSGLYDEILALVRAGVLRIGDRGAVELEEEWYMCIDFLVLSEMEELWSTKVDPKGKYGVHEQIRETLENNWIRLPHGWALTASPSHPIYEDKDWDAWRRTFEGNNEALQENADGVGKFGF